jgi:hypothetical protein
MSTRLTRTLSTFVSLAAALLCAGCAVVGSTQSGSHQATGVLGDADGSTTDKMEFAIEQNEPPVTMQGTRMISVPFDMVVRNVSARELTVKRISLESLGGGPVEIDTTRWNYDKTIRPGQTERIAFWAKMNVGNSRLGLKTPMVTRSTVLFTDATGEQTEALFTRTINGDFSVAIGIGP